MFDDNATSDGLYGAATLQDLGVQRVAVCMVGATRTLLQRTVHISIKRFLLDSQLVPVDLFMHLHLGWDHTDFAPGMGHHVRAWSKCHSPKY